ncbi:MAG: HD domain-containing protein [Christensenellales bacterium]
MTQDECKNLDELVATLVKYHPEADVELVKKAYHFAEKAHAGQLRKSGEPYFVHPLTVAGILAKLMLDAPTIAAGLLHDTVEDCDDVTIEVIEKGFRAGSCAACRWRNQAETFGLYFPGRTAGRIYPQDDSGDEQGYPCCAD